VGTILGILVPGAGHIALDRHGRGLFLFFLFLFFLNAALLPDIYPWERALVRILGAGGAAGVWLFSAAEFLALRRASRRSSG
jgi:hypothetical protein